MQYRTIRAAASAEFVEKRSRFIGYISPVTTQQDAIAFIDSIKSKHWDATHNVPAYIIRNGNICRNQSGKGWSNQARRKGKNACTQVV